MRTHVLEQLGWMLSGKLAFLKRFLPTPSPPLLLGVVGEVICLLSPTLTGVSGWLSSSRLLLFILLGGLGTSASSGPFVVVIFKGPFVEACLAGGGDVFSLIGRVV